MMGYRIARPNGGGGVTRNSRQFPSLDRGVGVRMYQWQDDADCAKLPPQKADEIFFGNGSIAQAERICGGCPVNKQCGAFADRHLVTHGVWAGESGHTRRHRLGVGLAGEPVAVGA